MTLTSACGAIVGAVVSRTVIVKLVAVEALPAASWALQVTECGPSENVLPDTGRQLALLLPSTASVVAGLA